MSDPTATQPVTVYWRPGCGFCAGLLRGLEKTGLAHERVNIWEDEAAAAHVRSVANGNETVPTVAVGDVVAFTYEASDADTDPLTFALDTAPAGATTR